MTHKLISDKIDEVLMIGFYERAHIDTYRGGIIMALVQCKKCGKWVNDNDPACPGCGEPISQKYQYGGTQPAGMPNVPKQTRFWETTWFCILMMFCCCFPLGIFLMWKYKKFNKPVRIAISAFFGMMMLISIFSMSSDDDDETAEAARSVAVETEMESTEGETAPETTEDTIESVPQKETDPYGWTEDDYTEFYVALSIIADDYLTNYKLPHYSKWQFVKFDDKGRIIAMTDELIFKDDHNKHPVMCVFSLEGEVKENGLHETVRRHFFCTDEKVYYDDGSCDEVFEKIKALSQ